MVFATAGPSSFWVWLVLFGSFGGGYWLRDLLSRQRRKRWRRRHDVLREWVEAGPERKEAQHHAGTHS